jgi:hypothetical protein
VAPGVHLCIYPHLKMIRRCILFMLKTNYFFVLIGLTFLSGLTLTACEGEGGPQMEMDSSGNTVAIWPQSFGNYNVINAATHPYGGSWTSPVQISPSSQNSFSPALEANGAGDAVAVWSIIDTSSGNMRIQSSQLPFGGSWTAPVFVSDASANAMTEYELLVDDAGYIVLLWTTSIGSGAAIYSSTATFGGAWSTPVQVSP